MELLLLLQNLHCICRDEKIEEWGVLLLNIICVLLFCQRDKNWVFILMCIVLEFLSFFPIVAMQFQFLFFFGCKFIPEVCSGRLLE
jgi:hypothetical protein